MEIENKKQLDVCIFHPQLKQYGGAEQLIRKYKDHSSNNIEIVTLYKDADSDIEAKALCNTSTPSGTIWRSAKTIFDTLTINYDFNEYDILLVSESGFGSMINLNSSNVKKICYCHTILRAAHQFYYYYIKKINTLIRPLTRAGLSIYRVLERIAWKKFSKVICNSSNTAKTIKSAGLNENPSIINPGAELDEFHSQKSERIFLYPSRFKKYKRQELAIKAFKEFEKTSSADYKLILTGYVDDEEYYERLKIKHSSNNIEFKPNLNKNNLIDLYGRSKAIIFTAKEEDWGIVPIESMASGKPVIAVNEGGPKEIINHQKNGFLAEPTPSEIARFMLELSQNEKLYSKMCYEAKKTSEKYSWSNFAQKMDDKLRDSIK